MKVLFVNYGFDTTGLVMALLENCGIHCHKILVEDFLSEENNFHPEGLIENVLECLGVDEDHIYVLLTGDWVEQSPIMNLLEQAKNWENFLSILAKNPKPASKTTFGIIASRPKGIISIENRPWTIPSFRINWGGALYLFIENLCMQAPQRRGIV